MLDESDVEKWTSEEVARWIRKKLNLSDDYSDIIIKEGIDGLAFLQMNLNKFEEIGMNKMGHRLHVYMEIERLRKLIEIKKLKRKISKTDVEQLKTNFSSLSFYNFDSIDFESENKTFRTEMSSKEFLEKTLASERINKWDQNEVVQCLKTFHLTEDYSFIIEKQKITGKELLKLTDNDWKKYGVTKMGDRLKIEKWSKKFRPPPVVFVTEDENDDLSGVQSLFYNFGRMMETEKFPSFSFPTRKEIRKMDINKVIEWIKMLDLSKDYSNLIREHVIDGHVLLLMHYKDWIEMQFEKTDARKMNQFVLELLK